MKRNHLSIAVLVSAALGAGVALAQDKTATQSAAKAAAKSSTQVAQAGGAAATTTGGASTGAATTVGGAVSSFGSAVVTAIPHIGIAAGMSAVGSASANQSSGSATQH
jgi:hypothetical protein